MSVENEPLRRILEGCVRIEELAEGMYASFACGTDAPELGAFWQKMAAAEKRHRGYWAGLLDAVESLPPDLLVKPALVLAELERVERDMAEAVAGGAGCPGDKTEVRAFAIAFRLEFYLLHPAFEQLFRTWRQIAPEPIDEDYAQHIYDLVEAARSRSALNPELELAAEVIVRLFESNRVLASQLAEIRRLRGFIPICAWCKKIRNDEGYWEQVEQYIASHCDATFTHGICPECRVALGSPPKRV